MTAEYEVKTPHAVACNLYGDNDRNEVTFVFCQRTVTLVGRDAHPGIMPLHGATINAVEGAKMYRSLGKILRGMGVALCLLLAFPAFAADQTTTENQLGAHWQSMLTSIGDTEKDLRALLAERHALLDAAKADEARKETLIQWLQEAQKVQPEPK